MEKNRAIYLNLNVHAKCDTPMFIGCCAEKVTFRVLCLWNRSKGNKILTVLEPNQNHSETKRKETFLCQLVMRHAFRKVKRCFELKKELNRNSEFALSRNKHRDSVAWTGSEILTQLNRKCVTSHVISLCVYSLSKHRAYDLITLLSCCVPNHKFTRGQPEI